MANPWDNDPIVQAAPAPTAAGAKPWENDPIVEPAGGEKPPTEPFDYKGMATEALKSAGTGAVEGAAGLTGLPGLAEKYGRKAINYVKPGTVSPETKLAQPQDMLQHMTNVTGPLHEPQGQIGKYAETIGQFLPAALAPEALGGVAGGLGRKLATAGAMGAGSELAGQTAHNIMPDVPFMEPAARMAGGLIGGNLAGVRAPSITPERSNYLQVLKAEGINPTAGQALGSDKLQMAENEYGRTFLTGFDAQKHLEDMQDGLTKAAMRRVGVTDDGATPDGLARADQNISGMYNQALNGQTLRGSPQMANDLQGIVQRYEAQNIEPRGELGEHLANLNQQMAARGGAIDGTTYNNFRSMLGNRARGAMRDTTKDPQYGRYLYEFQDALDRHFEAGLPPDLQGVLQQARTAHRDKLIIDRAVATGGSKEGQAYGRIGGPALASAAQQVMGTKAYNRATDGLPLLAKAFNGIVRPLPRSGTPERLQLRHLANEATVGGFIGGEHAGLHGVLGGGLIGAGLGLAAPAVYGHALMSKPVQGFLKSNVSRGPRPPNLLQRAPTRRLTGPNLATLYARTLALRPPTQDQGPNPRLPQ